MAHISSQEVMCYSFFAYMRIGLMKLFLLEVTCSNLTVFINVWLPLHVHIICIYLQYVCGCTIFSKLKEKSLTGEINLSEFSFAWDCALFSIRRTLSVVHWLTVIISQTQTLASDTQINSLHRHFSALLSKNSNLSPKQAFPSPSEDQLSFEDKVWSRPIG